MIFPIVADTKQLSLALTSCCDELKTRLLHRPVRKASKQTLARRTRAQMREFERYLQPLLVRWLFRINLAVKKAFRKIVKQEEVDDILIDSVPWDVLEEEGYLILKPAQLKISQLAVDRAATFAGIEAAFDVTNPAFVARAEKNAGKLVRGVLSDVKENIRQTVTTGIRNGWSQEQMVPVMTKGLPLVPSMQGRILREVAEMRGKGIDESEVLDYLEEETKYASEYRSFMIARTESAKAMSDGALDSYGSADIGQVERIEAPDSCEECLPFDGQIYTIEEAEGVLPAHPNCRGAWVAVVE